jgi:putative hydrolase of the HAD superfamily
MSNSRGWLRPQGLLLDAMGTLIGLRRSVGQDYAAVAGTLGLSLDAQAIDRVFPAIYRLAPPLTFPGLPEAELRQAELQWWQARIETVLEQIGAPDASRGRSGELSQALFAHYGHADAWHVYRDVPARLRHWRDRELKLAVVSNFDGRLHGLLGDLGLAPWLDAVVISSSAGAAKPHPAPFHQALAALDLQPQQVWHVGDSPEDVAGARAAGLTCVLVRRP